MSPNYMALSTAYGFKMIENKGCDENEFGDYINMEDAKVACKKDENCFLIHNVGCNDQDKFHLCPQNAIQDSDKSCVHEKFVIGNA